MKEWELADAAGLGSIGITQYEPSRSLVQTSTVLSGRPLTTAVNPSGVKCRVKSALCVLSDVPVPGACEWSQRLV